MSAPLPKYAHDLDPSLYEPTPTALEFLCKTITSDEEELKERIIAAQREAYDVHPFPCILRFQFIRLRMSEHSLYPRILELAAGENDSILLDLGCCMGTDLRKIVLDGFPAERAIGFDLFPAFMEVGHKLWRDKDSCAIKFLPGNIFRIPDMPVAANDGPLKLSTVARFDDLVGKIRYLFTGSVFHLFDEKKQAEMAFKVAALIDRKPGSIIFGRHSGADEKGIVPSHRVDEPSFGHSPASWKELWHQIFTQVESAEFADKNVAVDAELLDGPIQGSFKRRILQWSVRII